MMMLNECLQLRVLVKLVEDDALVLAALELDHEARALAVGLVAHVGDAGDCAFVDQLGDALDDEVAVDLVGDLGEDDVLLAALELLDVRAGADRDRAAAGGVAVA